VNRRIHRSPTKLISERCRPRDDGATLDDHCQHRRRNLLFAQCQNHLGLWLDRQAHRRIERCATRLGGQRDGVPQRELPAAAFEVSIGAVQMMIVVERASYLRSYASQQLRCLIGNATEETSLTTVHHDHHPAGRARGAPTNGHDSRPCVITRSQTISRRAPVLRGACCITAATISAP